ncbi:MAG: hypothetical protein HY774_03025 [Acidobacteria bacterium]|nr:hypothetical protein [Acidobacteriota bacterium]
MSEPSQYIKSFEKYLHILEPHNPKHRGSFRGAPQTSFANEGEEPRVVHPVPIPDSAIKALITTEETLEDFLNCFHNNERVTVQLLRDLIRLELICSEIDLNDDGLIDLLAIESNNGDCSFGASNGVFWALLNSPKGYKVIMAAQGAGFDVLKTKTNGVKNIRLVFVGGGEFNESRLVFNGKKYVLKRAKRH